MATNLSNLSVEQLKRAVQIKEEITRLEAELGRVLGGGSAGNGPSGGGGRRGVMSAAARERIAAAQRARWARVKGTAGAQPAPKAASAKPGPRKMSAAARAKIAAAARARWARVRAGK